MRKPEESNKRQNCFSKNHILDEQFANMQITNQVQSLEKRQKWKIHQFY